MRADQFLMHKGLATSRSQAARLIDAGARWLCKGEWKTLRKSDDLHEDAKVELLNPAESKYVSRGGLKLEGALAATGVDVRSKTCLDVGQSTGGFTDCLLRHGAQCIVGVDVGHSQLHPSLRTHAQVACLENVNARTLSAIDFRAIRVVNTWTMSLFDRENTFEQGIFDVIVGDVSFISQTLIIEALTNCLKPMGHLLMLVKPQFELQPEQIAKGGIVKDMAHYTLVEQRIRTAYAEQNLQVHNYFASPIEGSDGNREFFVHAVKV